MASVFFYLRDNSAPKPQPITLVFRYRKQRLKFSTNLKVPPKYWDAEKQRVKNTSHVPDRDGMNAVLTDLEAAVNRYYAEATMRKDFSLGGLKTFLQTFRGDTAKPAVPETLFEFCRRFIRESAGRVLPNGKTVNGRTIQKYQATLDLLEVFAKENYQYRGLDFADVDLEFHQDFTKWLQKRPHKKGTGYSANAIGKHFQVVKTFLNEANAQGVSAHQTHKSKYFNITKEESENVYLNESELAALLDLPLAHLPYLERVRDLFIIGAWTGLRFADFSALDPARHFVEQGGERFIEIEADKSDKKVLIPEFPAVRSIVEKYGGQLPRQISNQKFNEYLKEVCKLAGIRQPVTKGRTVGGVRRVDTFEKWELVSTHTARRSFATNFYNMGAPSISIMRVTGHKTEESFLKYIKAGPKEHADLLKMAFKQDGAKTLKGKIVNF